MKTHNRLLRDDSRLGPRFSQVLKRHYAIASLLGVAMYHV